MSLSLGIPSTISLPNFSFFGGFGNSDGGSSIGGLGGALGSSISTIGGGGSDTNIFGPIDSYPPIESGGGGSSSQGATNTITDIGNAVANVARAITGNYPQQQTQPVYQSSSAIPPGYHRDASGQLVADVVGQTASGITKFIQQNSGLLLTVGAVALGISALRKK